MYLRPSPPSSVGTAWSSLAGQHINDHKPVAGNGIIVKQGPNGSIISLVNSLDPVNFTYQGAYDFSAGYDAGDVVFVDPNVSYYDENDAPLPVCSGSSFDGNSPICAGLFVCTQFVPPLGYDSDMLNTSVATAYAASNQRFTSDLVNTFRWYDYNVYYPIYPVIPDEYATTVTSGSCEITANLNYWEPLSPMILLNSCVNNAVVPIYVNGILSGSAFNPDFVPYTA